MLVFCPFCYMERRYGLTLILCARLWRSFILSVYDAFRGMGLNTNEITRSPMTVYGLGWVSPLLRKWSVSVGCAGWVMLGAWGTTVFLNVYFLGYYLLNLGRLVSRDYSQARGYEILLPGICRQWASTDRVGFSMRTVKVVRRYGGLKRFRLLFGISLLR